MAVTDGYMRTAYESAKWAALRSCCLIKSALSTEAVAGRRSQGRQRPMIMRKLFRRWGDVQIA